VGAVSVPLQAGSAEPRALPWVEPYQPRLDWQMWFAALSNARENPWFIRMMVGLLRGRNPSRAFRQTPFSGTLPKFVRATIYEYRFTSWSERQKTGNYWKREIKGLYFPVVVCVRDNKNRSYATQ
jgi:hypothetical protein